MPNWCSNTLTIEGPADDVAKGLWLAQHEHVESDRPHVRREIANSDGTTVPCHEFDTVDEPPVKFLKLLSRMLPVALVKCEYWEPFGGKRGFLSYRAGELYECHQERFVLEEAPRAAV